jgi:hypothetical protein
LHVGTSEFYASIWPFQVDLVFLDASHDYESVKKDIAVWAPHVRPGGILCGHDYGTKVYDSRTNEIGQQYDGVAAAVSEILPASVNGAVWKKQM